MVSTTWFIFLRIFLTLNKKKTRKNSQKMKLAINKQSNIFVNKFVDIGSKYQNPRTKKSISYKSFNKSEQIIFLVFSRGKNLSWLGTFLRPNYSLFFKFIQNSSRSGVPNGESPLQKRRRGFS